MTLFAVVTMDEWHIQLVATTVRMPRQAEAAAAAAAAYSRLSPNLSQVVEELRQVGLQQPLKLQAQRHNALQGREAETSGEIANDPSASSAQIQGGKRGSLQMKRRRWSAAGRSSGCTFP